MKAYKNELGRYEIEDGTTLTSGHPIKYYESELGVWLEGRIEHNGDDYYFFNPNGKHLPMYNGVEVKDNRKSE